MYLTALLPIVCIVSCAFATPVPQDATAAAVVKSDYITVQTVNVPKASYFYPDTLAAGNEYYGESTYLNVTCWIKTTMEDQFGIINGDSLWLGTPPNRNLPGTKAYIARAYLTNQTIAYKERLNPCPPVTHGVGRLQSQYFDVSNLTCYTKTKLQSTKLTEYARVWQTIACYVLNGQKVNGNTTWARYQINPDYADQSQTCYIPGSYFNSTQFHGTAGICS